MIVRGSCQCTSHTSHIHDDGVMKVMKILLSFASFATHLVFYIVINQR